MKKLVTGTKAPPAACKSQDAVAHVSTSMPEKPWGDVLSRRQIEADYGWSSKTTARMEKDGKLVSAVVGGKGEGKTKRYYRSDIEKLLRQSYEGNLAWQQAVQASYGKEIAND